MYGRARKYLAWVCSWNFDSPNSPPKGSDCDSSPKNTGFFKVEFPWKSQDAQEEQLFSLRRSPAPRWHHGKVSSARLCPALARPELVVTERGWWPRKGATHLLKSCQTCGSKDRRGSPSLCSGSTPLFSWRGHSWVWRLPGLGSVSGTHALFSSAVPGGCRGVTQCHCAAHS